MKLPQYQSLIALLTLALLPMISGCQGGSSSESLPAVSAYSVDKIQQRTLLGAYLDQDAWDTDIIDNYNSDTDKALSFVNIFSSFDMDWNYLSIQSSNIVARDAVPIISWMPTINARQDDSLLVEISNGEWDEYIDGWINGFRVWRNQYDASGRPTILIRFAHEFNSDWFSWSNQPAALKQAWRHLHQRFEYADMDKHVEWVWAVNNVDVDAYNDFTEYYPGDDMVDWVAIDGYNWGSNYHYSQWKSFNETFSSAYVKMVTSFPNKPVMIAEVASAEPTDLPDAERYQYGDDTDSLESKADWVADMMQIIKSDYPAIKSVIWFNSNKELSWGLNAEHNTGLAAYNAATEGSHYIGLADLSSETALAAKPELDQRLPTVTGVELLRFEAESLKQLSRDERRALRLSRFTQ